MSVLDDFRALLLGIGVGRLATIGFDERNGLEISTVVTPDQGPETALRDANKTWYIVERYSDVEAAQRGHREWVSKADTLTCVTEIGYGSSIESSVVQLVRSTQ